MARYLAAIPLALLLGGQLHAQDYTLHSFAGWLNRDGANEPFASTHVVWGRAGEGMQYVLWTEGHKTADYLVSIEDEKGGTIRDTLAVNWAGSPSALTVMGRFARTGWHTITVVSDEPLYYQAELFLTGAAIDGLMEYADAAGDALRVGSEQYVGANYVSPDLTHARVWLTTETLHAKVTFDPRTFDKDRTEATVYFNVDGDQRTGSRGDRWPKGTDISFSLGGPAHLPLIRIWKWTPAGEVSQQQVQSWRAAQDNPPGVVSFTVPRSLLGDLARLQFYVTSDTYVTNNGTSGVLDLIPGTNYDDVQWITVQRYRAEAVAANVQPQPTLPSSFCFSWGGADGRRDWRRASNTEWIERYQNGREVRMTGIGTEGPSGLVGEVVTPTVDRDIEIFIPPAGPRSELWVRRAGQAWTRLVIYGC